MYGHLQQDGGLPIWFSLSNACKQSYHQEKDVRLHLHESRCNCKAAATQGLFLLGGNKTSGPKQNNFFKSFYRVQQWVETK